MFQIKSRMPGRRQRRQQGAADVARFLSAAILGGLLVRCPAQAPVGASPPKAEAGSPEAPAYQLSRQDEDFSFLRDAGRRTDSWDPLKYVPLDRRGWGYLTFAGEMRERIEYINHNEWGLQPQQRPYLLQRARLSADLHLGDSLRLFGELESSLIEENQHPPTPIQQDQADILQLFVDVKAPANSFAGATLRFGRQDFTLGSGRLVNVREGPNVRESFDGLRAWISQKGWRLDSFYAHPVTIGLGDFDDHSNDGIAFWGVYATTGFKALPAGNADFYFIGYSREDAPFYAGTAAERRNTFGTRLFGNAGTWDYNWEGFFQNGTFGDRDISAWAVASSIAYTSGAIPLKPRTGLRFDVSSGNGDPGGKTLGTANPMFPTGQYINEAYLDSEMNLVSLMPFCQLHPGKRVTLTTGIDWQWRESVHDGLYTNAITPLVAPNGSRASYVGNQVFVELDYHVSRHLTSSLGYVHFIAGDFLRQAAPGENVDYAAFTLAYKF